MKKSNLWTGILAITLVFGMAITACGGGDDGGGNGKKEETPTISSFAGTWNASGGRSIVFSGSSFTYKVNGTTTYSGTFSVSGSTITFNESSLGTASGNFSLSGNTLTFSNHTWDSSVNGTYTKDSGSGGNTNPGDITYTAVPDNTTATTAITLTFSAAVTGLTANDITVTDGTGSAAKGTLAGSGTSWSLGITVNTAGNVTVSINKNGIESAAKTVAVAKPSGMKWTAVTGSTFVGRIRAIAYGGTAGQEKFVAGGGSKMATSTDGATWTAVTDSTFGTSDIYAIAYGGGKFVAGSTDGKMATSTDGATWTAVTDSTFGTSDIYAIAYGGGKFVAGGRDGKIATSTDGETWTAVTQSIFGTSSTNYIYVIAYGGGKFVASGVSNNSKRIATSTDGVTWTTGAIPSNNSINAIAYGGTAGQEKFVVADGSRMVYSTDGITWTAVTDSTFSTTSLIAAIAYGGTAGQEKFVAAGEKRKIAYSTDGTTWTAVSNSTFETGNRDDIILAIAYGNGTFVAGGTGGKIVYSSDN